MTDLELAMLVIGRQNLQLEKLFRENAALREKLKEAEKPA